MKNSVIDRIRARTQPETRTYVRKNLDIAVRVNELLRQKGWSQKDLAKTMGKTESEVSRWLSGLHNVTLKTIVKMETVLEADILIVPTNTDIPSQTTVLFGTESLIAVSEPMTTYQKIEQ